jgi:MFS transporter, PAT family, beta-lactamase induction signal transducer AmpG
MIEQDSFARPYYFFFLMFPGSLSEGFVVVTLPYLLTHKGFSVAQTAAIVAIGLSTNILRFIWAPLVDLTLSLRRWYWLGVAASTGMLLLLCLVPLTPKDAVFLTVIVVISQVAGRFSLLPIGGFMAHRVRVDQRGRAAGWYQAGGLGAVGLGGGAGLWLATHYNPATAGVGLGVVSLLCALTVLSFRDVRHEERKHFFREIAGMARDVFSMVKVPVVLFVIILLMLPIGTGAAANLWSAIAGDWKTNADTVALVTGLLSGLAGALGSLLGGFIADRWGNWIAYLGSGTICALITILMAVSPFKPEMYIVYVLAYAFGLGMLNAAFSSLILYAIGKKNATTKYTLLTSLGNIPVVYMTALDGWSHDRHNSVYMLVFEAVIGIIFVLISTTVLRIMMRRNLVPRLID